MPEEAGTQPQPEESPSLSPKDAVLAEIDRDQKFQEALVLTPDPILTVGLILIHQDDGISWLGIHIALVALALMLAKHNQLALLKKW